MTPRALRAEQFDDVLTIIEFMRDQALVVHDRNVETAAQLNDRLRDIEKREAALKLRQRAIEAVLKSQPDGVTWVRRIFRRMQ